MIKNYLTYINEKSEYGDRFIPYDIFENMWSTSSMNEYDRLNPNRFKEEYSRRLVMMSKYEKVMRELMVGKYARFSVNVKKGLLSRLISIDNYFDKTVELKEGYVESLSFDNPEFKPNFNVKIKNGKNYTVNCLGEVRVYDTKPDLISTKEDPYGEEDWDD